MIDVTEKDRCRGVLIGLAGKWACKSARVSLTKSGRATTEGTHRTCFGQRPTSLVRRLASLRRWNGRYHSPGLPTTVRFLWVQSAVPVGVLRLSRNDHWPMSKSSQGSGRRPRLWLRTGPGRG